MTLHTALSLLAESTAAFGSVWWSEDGQLLVLTQNAIYILTPDLGIFFDPDSAVSATPTITSVEPPPKLGWYRTMLSVDKSTPNVWALDCENQAVLATGSVEVMFKAACWSPSGVSNEGLCLLAVLTSNLDISLYSPTRNHLRAAWIKIQDVTEVLKKYFKSHPLVEDSNDETVARTLSAQSQAIAWSETPPLKGRKGIGLAKQSLLAVGNRSGSVAFLRIAAEAPELRVITTHLVSAQWIVRLSWSSWSNGTNGSDYCLLACALPDGSIKLLKITLVSENNEASDIAIEEADTRLVARADRRGITAMTWVNARGNESLLVYAKPGTIHVWSKTFGLRTLLLERQAVCAGSSSLVPATGIVYDKIQDTILISLSDSSVHVVYQASTNATLQPSGSIDESSQTSMSSINLTLTSRSFASIVHKLEFQRGLDAGDLAVTSGFTFFDAFGTMVWFAEMVRPQDLDYKPSAKRRSTLIVARLYDDDPTPDLLLDYAKDILNGPVSGRPPVAQLRPLLLHLRNPNTFAAIRDRLLVTLGNKHATEGSDDIIGEHDVSATYGLQLIHALGGNRRLSKAYVRLGIAHACAAYHKSSDFAKVASSILVQVAQLKLEAVIRIWTRCIERVWSDADRLYARLVVTQALLLPAVPQSLRAAALSFGSSLQLELSGDATDYHGSNEALSSSTQLTASESLGESCPACGSGIRLTDLISATCERGHKWQRCSITSLLMSTAIARTCMVCCRKALVSTRQGTLPEPWTGAWTVSEMLEAVQRCVWCGNEFVGIVQ